VAQEGSKKLERVLSESPFVLDYLFAVLQAILLELALRRLPLSSYLQEVG
jgi:hypothetical protein